MVDILKRDDEKEEKEKEPHPFDYILSINPVKLYEVTPKVEELKKEKTEKKEEQIMHFTSIVERGTLDTLKGEKDYTDDIQKYSAKLVRLFKNMDGEDADIKERAYRFISKNPENYLKIAEKEYKEDIERLGEREEKKLKSIKKTKKMKKRSGT